MRRPSRVIVASGVGFVITLASVAAAGDPIAPRLIEGRLDRIEPFLFVPFDSFLYAVDILGYSFMSVATLLASRVFTGDGLHRTARRCLTANGLLLPFIALQMYVQSLIWIASLWAITFPASTWSLALLFRRAATSTDGIDTATTQGDI